jgi:hypothetical protein
MQQPTHATVLYAPGLSLPLLCPGSPAFMVIMQALREFADNSYGPLKEAAELGKHCPKLASEVATAEQLLAVMEASFLAFTGGAPN